MAKIKVLHIIKSLGRGGAEVLLPETLKLHDKNRFEFHYIYFLPWKDQMVSKIRESGGTVTCLKSGNNIKMLSQVYNIISYCKAHGIHLIHCHLPWSGFLGRMVHFKTGIPLIYTEHNIQERYHWATKFLNKLTFNYQTIALGVSNDVSRSINYNINPSIPVKTLLNGVNTSFFKQDQKMNDLIREKYKFPENSTVIGNVAVFREQKNIPDWIKAFKQISEKNSNVYGLLVGAGPEESKIKNMVIDMQLEGKVILPGLQTDTIAFFSTMDIFMMSSSFEGLPIALLEAMSTECATVSTKAGGVVEVIRDKVDGHLCEVGDYNCLANKVINLIENSEERSKFQKAARTRIENSFSLTLMVSELEKVYNSLI